MYCRQYFFSVDSRRLVSCSEDDGICRVTKKGLVQHSGGRSICKYIRPETKVSKTCVNEDDLRNVGPVDAQIYLDEMSWNEDDHSFSLSCRCGGIYSVSKDEAEDVTMISCDTCSLIIELLHSR